MKNFSEITSIDSQILEDEEKNENRASLNDSNESTNQYWDNVLEIPLIEQELSEDDILNSIYDVDEKQFSYTFKDYDSIHSIMENFRNDRWKNLEGWEKVEVIGDLMILVSKELELKSVPEVYYYNGSVLDCGKYNKETKSIGINSVLLNNPIELVDTIIHELRHAYQHERAEMLETFTDLLYKENFNYYINPIKTNNGSYITFMDYWNQLVEVDARAYANAFIETGWNHV